MQADTIGAAIHEIAETLQREANVRAVFGEPIDVGSQKIVPVAVISIGGGGGGGQGHGPPASGEGGAAAMGLGVTVVPIGFIHEESGKVVYTAISGAREALGHGHAGPAAIGVEAASLGARVLGALRHRRAT